MDLSLLPSIQRLKALTQSLAILDLIICPDLEGRYHYFQKHWGSDISLYTLQDGSGDHLFAFFTSAGVVVKGFAHESPMSPYLNSPPKLWSNVLENVPIDFAEILADPAFSREETTFCIWRLYKDLVWQQGNVSFPPRSDPDGSVRLLKFFDDNPQTYQTWAEEYYEQPINLATVEQIYNHFPLTQEMVEILNQSLLIKELEMDVQEIGYPVLAT